MEQLIIFLLFVVGSIISSIIQHKKKQAEAQQQRELEELTGRTPESRQSNPPVSPVPPWPQAGGDWQEQLRRLLQGETAPPQPPPVIKPVLLPPEQPRKQAPQPQRRQQRYEPRRQGKPAQTQPAAAATRTAQAPARTEKSEGDADYGSPFRESSVKYQRAANLHASVQERFRGIVEKTTTHKSAPGVAHRATTVGSQSAFVKRLRRNPRAMRDAFIASVIFGPAKSFENEPSVLS